MQVVVALQGGEVAIAPKPPLIAEGALGYAFIPDLVDGVQLSVTAARAHPLYPGDILIGLAGRAGAEAGVAEKVTSIRLHHHGCSVDLD